MLPQAWYLLYGCPRYGVLCAHSFLSSCLLKVLVLNWLGQVDLSFGSPSLKTKEGRGNQNQNSHIVILVMSRRLSKGFVNLNKHAPIWGESDFPENGEYVINIIQTSVVSEMLLPAFVTCGIAICCVDRDCV